MVGRTDRKAVSVSALVVVVLALCGAMLAGASDATLGGTRLKALVTDPRDAGGSLDLRGARSVVSSRDCRVKISTWGTWNTSLLRGGNYAPGRNRLAVVYDLNGDGKADVTAYIISEARGAIYLFLRTSSDTFSPAAAWRPNASSINVSLCRFLYEAQPPLPKSVRAAFISINGAHHDRMPNRGWVRLHNPMTG
jgi:hypothetical protein